MRIENMITRGEMLWSFIKFSPLILKVWRSVWRICDWTLGLKFKMLSIGKKYCLIVYLFSCTFLSMLVIDDNYSFYFLAEKKALLSQVRSTESFLDIFVMYFCFYQLFSNRLSQNFQHQLFHEFTFPALQTEAEPAQSVERWPAEKFGNILCSCFSQSKIRYLMLCIVLKLFRQKQTETLNDGFFPSDK